MGGTMNHVPEHLLPKYRQLKIISDLLDRAGDYLGERYAEDANTVYSLSSKYRAIAQELRVKP